MNEKKKIWIVLTGMIVIIILMIVLGILSSVQKQKIVDSFNKSFESKTEEIVYLGRPDCSHCIAFKPVLQKVIADYNLSYLDINTDEVGEKRLNLILEKLEMDSETFGTPTTVIVKNKKVVETIIGEVSEEDLIKVLKENKVISK